MRGEQHTQITVTERDQASLEAYFIPWSFVPALIDNNNMHFDFLDV